MKMIYFTMKPADKCKIKKKARKTVRMKELLLTTVNNLKSFFHSLNHKKEIRSGIAPLTDGVCNLVIEGSAHISVAKG